MANILLIEPDVILASSYMGVLKYQGHYIRVCTTAQAAIDAADEERPDVVILEIRLVTHSGVEFLYEFRSYPEWGDIPIIILSTVPPGEFTASKEVLQRHLGVRCYQYKPHTTLKKLTQTVEEVLLSV